MRVRGLKQLSRKFLLIRLRVAPRAGAWIETRFRVSHSAWQVSHPVRVRGLKLMTVYKFDDYKVSHPVRVRGLKPTCSVRFAPLSCRTPSGCVD